MTLSPRQLPPLLCLTLAACHTQGPAQVVEEPNSEATEGSTVAADRQAASSAIPDRREFPVDAAVNPCTDFYAYTCNKVNAGFVLRDDRSRHTYAFHDSRERILEAKKEWLHQLSTGQPQGKRQQELQNVYLACMDVTASKTEEREAIARITATIGGLKNRRALQDHLTARIISGQTSLIDFGNVANHDDPDWDDVYLVARWRTLPERSYYADEEVRADLLALLLDFFTTIDMDRPAERAAWVLDYETRSAQAYPLPSEMRELFSSRTGISRKKLRRDYPGLRLNAFLARVPKRTHFRHITPAHFAFLDRALREDKLDALKSVAVYQAAQHYLDDAYPQYFARAFAFRHKHLGGPIKRPVRRERCTKMLMYAFEKELDVEMIDVLFADFPEQKFIALAEKIRQQIISSIASSDWLSEASKKGALAKMRAARLQLVKPKNEAEWNFNPSVDYSSDTPHKNAELLAAALSERTIRRLSEQRNRDRWGMGPLTVNAYYSPADNKFVMPLGILQYPFYDPELSEIANLGAVGVVIGHELGHGIDDKGSRYDSQGRLRNWMSAADLKEFSRRGSQLVGQFDRAGLNGQLTLGENIGDLTGLTFGYRASFPNNEGSLAEKKAFFTQYARLWCNQTRPKKQELQRKTDPHASGEARVNEQVKHQAGFREAFQCKKTDLMVIDPAVTIW